MNGWQKRYIQFAKYNHAFEYTKYRRGYCYNEIHRIIKYVFAKLVLLI